MKRATHLGAHSEHSDPNSRPHKARQGGLLAPHWALNVRRLGRLLILTALAMLCLVGTSLAGNFQASPIRVHLGPTARSAVVAVVNRGKDPIDLQVSVFTWAEGATGQMLLRESDGLTVFPTMLTLAPGESRKVRVGFPKDAPTREEAYRIIIEELPRPRGETPANAIAVRLRMSIPVFVQPAGGKTVLEVQAVHVAKGELAFALANVGGHYFKAAKIRVHVDLASGPFDTTLDGWYVLVGGQRNYVVALPAGACAARATIRVEPEAASPTSGAGTVTTTDVALDVRCGR